MSTRRRDSVIGAVRVGALTLLLALPLTVWASSPGGGPVAGGGTQAQAMSQEKARTQSREPCQNCGQVGSREQAEMQTREHERTHAGDAEGPGGPVMPMDPARERTREQAMNGTCTSLDMLLGVYLGAEHSPLWLRLHDQLRNASCQEAEAVLMAVTADELPGDRDRVRDQLHDGPCLPTDPDGCQGPRDYDYDHEYDHDYQAPGPHGAAGST